MGDIDAREPVATRRIGMLTPSSNTALEPISNAMVAPLGDVSLHFSRFRVTEISLSASGLDQFAPEGMLAAARLLADARVDAICWNGTSASWLGLDTDRALCAAIEQETGIPATSSVLAMVDALKAANLHRIGLVTPYTTAVQSRIVATLAAEGFKVTTEDHCGLTDNFAFAEVTPENIDRMLHAALDGKPDAVVVVCTNMRATPLVERFKAETGVPVLDSIATALVGGLTLAGIDPVRLRGWGRLFEAAVRT